MKTKLDSQMITIICLAVLGLFVAAAGYFTMVAPQGAKAAKLKTDIANAQTQLIVAQGAASRPVPFRASDLFRLANAMPSRTDMPGILLTLRHLADRSSVKLTSVRPSPPIPAPLGYSAVPVAVTLSGTYTEISKFVGLVRRDVRFTARGPLEVSGRFFDTDGIQLQPGEQADAKSKTSKTSKTRSSVLMAQVALAAFVYTGVVIAPTPPPGTSTDGSTTTTATTTSSAH